MGEVARGTPERGEVARGTSERGEVVLARRDDDALELRVNGVFVMDSRETSSERHLANAALAALDGTFADQADGSRPSKRIRVLVGGLGLGYTLEEVLRHPSVSQVVVVEIESDLVEWHRRGIVPPPNDVHVLDDPRVAIEIDDIRTIVRREISVGSSYDLVLLDVDNGPDYLVYDANAEVYRHDFLRACSRLVDGRDGAVAVWSSTSSDALVEALAQVFDCVDERRIPVRLGRRDATYHLYLGLRGRSPKV
jgi:spermidine synthase